MARRSPEEMLAVLEDQAREDEAVDAQMRALAAMSDAELDDHLRGIGLEPEQLEREALALYIQPPVESGSSLPTAVQAVPQQAPRPFVGGTHRRRPLAVAAWLAAGAAAATAGGALFYALTHPRAEQPAPHVPAPSPSEAPSGSSAPLPVGVSPSEAPPAPLAAPDAARAAASNKPPKPASNKPPKP
jgi:hypothetical protein